MAGISQIIVEMRRRHVFRVVGIYIVAAWVILQVASLAFESFGLPTEAMRFVWYALFIVSPLAVFWGWRYDITTDGIVRTPPASGGEAVDVGLRTPDFAVIAALAGIVLFVLAGTVTEISRLPQSIEHRYALNLSFSKPGREFILYDIWVINCRSNKSQNAGH